MYLVWLWVCWFLNYYYYWSRIKWVTTTTQKSSSSTRSIRLRASRVLSVWSLRVLIHLYRLAVSTNSALSLDLLFNWVMSHCRVLFTYLQFFQSFDWVSRSKFTAHVLIFLNRRVTSHVRKYARLSVGWLVVLSVEFGTPLTGIHNRIRVQSDRHPCHFY